MNWRRGFRRLTFLVALSVAIICGGIAVLIVHIKHDAAQREYEELQQTVKHRNNALLPKAEEGSASWWAELEAKYAVEPSPDHSWPDESWVNWSQEHKAIIYILTAISGAFVGFSAVWIVYRILEWLVMGFASDSVPPQTQC